MQASADDHSPAQVDTNHVTNEHPIGGRLPADKLDKMSSGIARFTLILGRIEGHDSEDFHHPVGMQREIEVLRDHVDLVMSNMHDPGRLGAFGPEPELLGITPHVDQFAACQRMRHANPEITRCFDSDRGGDIDHSRHRHACICGIPRLEPLLRLCSQCVDVENLHDLVDRRLVGDHGSATDGIPAGEPISSTTTSKHHSESRQHEMPARFRDEREW